MLAQARIFFRERGILEVDTPLLSPYAPIDAHIDVMQVDAQDNLMGFLHTSPEYGMKRLLADSCGDIYQLGHVFRRGESSKLHAPEFTMAEWYRIGFSFEDMIAETVEFIRLFLGPISKEEITYRDALKKYAGIDYVHSSLQDLMQKAQELGLALSSDATSWDRDTLLQCLMSFCVEPHLGKDTLLILRDYPASQAALAQTCQRGDETIAERFEVYYRSVELANGYHELTDAKEQLIRLEAENSERSAMGKSPLPIDTDFIAALTKGLPDCSGVAVGFDRLMMLRHNVTSIETILPFAPFN